MTELNQIYKCDICGNIVQMVHSGAGELVCCGQSMQKMQANTDEEAATEKHLPVIEKTSTGVLVKVGSVEHPSIPEHYIEWIEVIKGLNIYKSFLKPGDKPQAEFPVKNPDMARTYCNLHGLWQI